MLSARHHLSKICLIMLLLLVASSAWGQASVNENLESAFIYVDAKTGSDTNPGTKTQPLKTIGAAAGLAVGNNHSGVGTRVIISPGTYRGAGPMGGGARSASLPMTLEAVTNGA